MKLLHYSSAPQLQALCASPKNKDTLFHKHSTVVNPGKSTLIVDYVADLLYADLIRCPKVFFLADFLLL